MLVKDWKRVLLIGYSTWAFIAAIICLTAPDIIYRLFERDTNPYVWGRLGLMFLVGGLIGRLLEQGEKNKYRRRFVIFAVLIAAFSLSAPALASVSDREAVTFDLIAQWEGKRNASYLDIVGVPTICYGSTRGVQMGDYKTDSECADLLLHEINEYREGLFSYFTDITANCRMTNKRDAAYTSLAYNIGVRAAGKSTATRRLNDGDIEGGCHAIAWWNKAGGRVVRGLVNRRRAEVAYCLAGL